MATEVESLVRSKGVTPATVGIIHGNLHIGGYDSTVYWFHFILRFYTGAQWLSGRVLDSRPRGCGFEPHRHHCVVSLSKTH